MPTVVQFRRGTTAQNNNFTGAAGEISYDNEINTIRVHDGSTAGGSIMITSVSTATLTNKTMGASLLVADSDSYDLGVDGKRFRGAYLGTLYVKDGIVKATPSGVEVDSASAVVVSLYETAGAITSIEYQINASDNTAGKTQVSKILATFDGTNVASTEYGVVYTGDSDLGNAIVDNQSGTLRLLFTRRPSNNVIVKVHQTIIT